MSVDGLFAPPRHPSSVPRVRAFAERALKELRSGEGGLNLPSDKKWFSEFMYKVTESILLGHTDPPTAASIVGIGGEADSSSKEAETGSNDATNSDEDQNPSLDHPPGGNRRDWSAKRSFAPFSPRDQPIATDASLGHGPARANPTLFNASEHRGCGRSPSGAQQCNGFCHGLPEVDKRGCSLLEELRRWRYQAEGQVGSFTSSQPPSVSVSVAPPPLHSSQPIPRSGPDLSAFIQEHANAKASKSLVSECQENTTAGGNRFWTEERGSNSRYRACKNHDVDSMEKQRRTEQPPSSARIRRRSFPDDPPQSKSSTPPTMKAAEPRPMCRRRHQDNPERHRTVQRAVDYTGDVQEPLEDAATLTLDSAAKAAVEFKDNVQRAFDEMEQISSKPPSARSYDDSSTSGEQRVGGDLHLDNLVPRLHRVEPRQGSQCVEGVPLKVDSEGMKDDDPFELSLDLSECSDEKLERALRRGPSRESPVM